MKYKEFIPFILIIICILLLIIYQNHFQFIQNALILESNNLFSSHHILADETINNVWKSSKTADDKFHLFGVVESTSKQTVMAFYSTNYSTFKPPLKNGSFFTKANSKEAIIGKNIKTEIKNGMEYFNYNNINYKVVGQLGISDDSPLKKHVLINDTSFLENNDVPLIFDGSDIEEIKWLKGKSMANKGVERWFNINFISKLIQLTTFVIVFCSSALAAYFFVIATKEERYIRFQIGISIKKILKRDLLLITFITFFITISIGILSIFQKMEISIINILISYIMFLIVLLITYIILTIYQINKETAND